MASVQYFAPGLTAAAPSPTLMQQFQKLGLTQQLGDGGPAISSAQLAGLTGLAPGASLAEGSQVIHAAGGQRFVVPLGTAVSAAVGGAAPHRVVGPAGAQQLPAGTQLVTALTAEGQLVTFAVGPSREARAQLHPSAGLRQQHLPLRQTTGMTTTIIIKPQGTRLVQVSNSIPRQATVASAPAGVYKLIQPTGAAHEQRILVHTAAGQQVQCLPFKHQPVGANSVAMLQAVPHGATLLAAAPATKTTPGVHMGRSLIQVAAPAAMQPGTAGAGPAMPVALPQASIVTAPPGPMVAALRPPAGVPLMQAQPPLQHLQFLSKHLVKVPGGALGATPTSSLLARQQQQASVCGVQLVDATAAAAALQTSGGSGVVVQQQVQDTAAQQRQQQLLASLRSRMALLHQQQEPGHDAEASEQHRLLLAATQASAVLASPLAMGPTPMLLDLQLAASGGASPRPLAATALAQQQLHHGGGSSSNGRSPELHSPVGSESALTVGSLNSDHHTAPLRSGAAEEQPGTAVGMGARAWLAGSAAVAPEPFAWSSCSSTANGAALGNACSTPQPPSVGSGDPAGDDLRGILCSIGVELARHGISVEVAVEAGTLGVLRPADVEVLREAFAGEQHRLALNALAATNVPLPPHHAQPPHLPLGAGHGASAASSPRPLGTPLHFGSQDSPATDVALGTGLAGVGPTAPPAAQSNDIDEALFSAFAYDFFGGADGGGGGEGAALAPLELQASGPTMARGSNGSVAGSSVLGSCASPGLQPSAAPHRAPSWAPHQDALTGGTAVAHGQNAGGPGQVSTTAMSDMGTSCGGGAKPTEGNKDLVARLAQLDLGCGFF